MIDYQWMIPIWKTWLHILAGFGFIITILAMIITGIAWYQSIVDHARERKRKNDEV